jgi:hypothetical protein
MQGFNSNNFKDKTEKDMKSKIVYRLNCLDCEKFYFGQSIRHVSKRKEQHIGNQESSVFVHARIGQRIDWDNIEILETAIKFFFKSPPWRFNYILNRHGGDLMKN